MRRNEPVVIKDMQLDEYILIIKYLMANSDGINHVSGFVNAPILFQRLSEQELNERINLAVKHGVITNNENGEGINPLIATFINAWIHSRNVVMLKKPSYLDKKAITFSKADGMYMAMVQDAKNNSMQLLADADYSIIYDYIAKEVDKKDVTSKYNIKKINTSLEERGSSCRLSINPKSQLILQSVANVSGKLVAPDTLINVGDNQFECISLNDKLEIEQVIVKQIDDKKEYIKEYIDCYCISDTNYIDKEGNADNRFEDPEPYTNLSFIKLTSDANFPKDTVGFFKLLINNYIKSFKDWKNIIKRILMVIVMSVITLLWNLFALCYLNDSFNIDYKAIFGNATAYLLAGVADTSYIIGFPTFIRHAKTVFITASLYYLLGIAIRNLTSDIANKKIKRNLSYFPSFPSKLKDYKAAVQPSLGYYIWSGLALASVLNIVLFNPFTVALLALMLMFSCIKCEEGALAPFLMVYSSSTQYKKIVNGEKKIPMFGDYQLRIFGTGIGLLFYSVINVLLWRMLSFNFWIRLAISITLLLLTLIKIGVIKVRKKIVVALLFVGALATQLISILSTYSVAFADDGGWTESGENLKGLINNYGWQTILTFSLILALAVAVGCMTAGIGSGAVILAASGGTFLGSTAFASCTDYGRKTAFDFVWGEYSPYGGDSKLASILSFTVGIMPGIGNAFGVVTGIRDLSYDVGEGDYIGAGLDIFGLAVDGKGLLDDGIKGLDDLTDLVKGTTFTNDDIVKGINSNIDKFSNGMTGNNNGIKAWTDDAFDSLRRQAFVTSVDENKDGLYSAIDEVSKGLQALPDELTKGNKSKIDNTEGKNTISIPGSKTTGILNNIKDDSTMGVSSEPTKGIDNREPSVSSNQPIKKTDTQLEGGYNDISSEDYESPYVNESSVVIDEPDIITEDVVSIDNAVADRIAEVPKEEPIAESGTSFDDVIPADSGGAVEIEEVQAGEPMGESGTSIEDVISSDNGVAEKIEEIEEVQVEEPMGESGTSIEDVISSDNGVAEEIEEIEEVQVEEPMGESGTSIDDIAPEDNISGEKVEEALMEEPIVEEDILAEDSNIIESES